MTRITNNEQIDKMVEDMKKMTDKELKEYNKGLPIGLARDRCKKCKVLVPPLNSCKLGVLTQNPNRQNKLSYMEGKGSQCVRKQINANDDLCCECYMYHTAVEGIDGPIYK